MANSGTPRPVKIIDVDKKKNIIEKRRVIQKLPGVFNTDLLRKFFEGTADNLFQPEISEKLSGFIGRVPAHVDFTTDFYINEPSKERQNHQLESSLITVDPDTNEISNIMFYDDLLNLLRFQGGLIDNVDRLFKTETYSWMPPINPDKLMNFTNYFWFPSGPDIVRFNEITDVGIKLGSSDPVTIQGVELENNMRILFVQDVNPLFNNRVFIVSGIGTSLALETDFELGRSGWDDIIVGWDDDPWDGANYDIIISDENPDYIVMERGALDNNPWSTGNRWYHRDELTQSQLSIALERQAVRPIIEFQKNIELYNHGTFGRRAVTVRDDITTDPDTQIVGQSGITIDGIDIRNGDSILFTNVLTLQGLWDEQGWDFENSSAFNSIPLTPPHPQFGQEGFEWATGTFDPFYNVSYSAPLGDISLTQALGQGVAITLAGNFTTLGFIAGMKITLSGTSSNDSLYTIQDIDITGKIMTFVEPLINSGDLTVINATFVQETVIYQNRVFEVSGIDTPSGIILTLITDGQNPDGSPADGDQIKVLLGLTHQDNEYYWSDSEDFWLEAQKKITTNQTPLFQLYDNNSIKLQDPGEYPLSDFAGNKIFSYQVNVDPRQPIDSILNIRLKFNNFSEIIFENHIVTDRYNFNLPQEEINGYYYYKIRGTTVADDVYNNEWNLKPLELRQYIVDTFKNIDTNIIGLTTEPTDVNSVEIFVNGNILLSNNWIVSGKNIIFTNTLSLEDYIEVKYYSATNTNLNAIYEMPLNLTANPDNLEVDFISNSEYFSHFTTVIKNQPDLIGSPNGSNNWRNTQQDRAVGEFILQHKAPLLKTMALGSDRSIDFMLSVRFVEREFSRFRNKFLRKIAEYIKDGIHNNTQSPTEWIDDVLTSINLGKINDFPFSLSGMGTQTNGEPTYYPSSPSRLGIFPVYKPGIYSDTTYNTPHNVIQMHDGSLILAYNDFRDEVILKFENNIYDSIPETYKTEELPDFDWTEYVSTKYYIGDYTSEEFIKLLVPIIQRWAVFNNLDLTTNNIYSPTDPFTWNYNKQGLPGYWRGIYKHYYDTDRPNTHPWEMFGFSQMPEWWETRYGAAPYTSSNLFLWNDMRAGRIANGTRAGIHARYTRTNAPTPVNGAGDLLDPVSLNIAYQPGIIDAKADWKIGDHGPVETIFRRSEFWSFAIAQISYLMKPAKFIELGWDANAHKYSYENQQDKQWINITSGDRQQTNELFVHGEVLTDGTVFVSNGIQQWITNYVTSNGQAITETFGNIIRNIGVRLAHKMGGFINANSTTAIADNFGLVPQEDISVLLYNSPSIMEELYSGVIIERVGTGWSVYGYDVLTPSFTMKIPVKSSQQISINIGTVRVLESKDYQNKTKIIPYGTIFATRQELYDFLIGYGKHLESRGWIFDNFDYDQNENNDWRLSGKQFLFWSQGNWANGSLITVSPSAEKITFRTDHGIVANVEQIINGVYSLLDREGNVINPEDTFVSREENTITIVPTTNSIFSVRLFVIEYEHAVTFNNRTIFNDLIYDPLLNLRQDRFKLFTTRAGGWTGKFNAPGYIITDNTLISNFEKSVNDIRKYFGIENSVDRVVLESSARHLVGFQSRDYLNGLRLSEDTQFQFYQGFIRQKGTRLVVDKLFRSDFTEGSGEIQIFEEWALRLGEFGAIQDAILIEFILHEEEWRGEPQLIEFKTTTTSVTADSLFDDIIEISTDDIRWVKKPPFDGIANFTYRSPTSEKRSKNAAYLYRTDVPVGGYVLDIEVAFHVETIDDRNAIFDTQKITLDAEDLKFGDLIWVDDIGNYYSINDPDNINDDDPLARFNHGFMVFRYTNTGLTFNLPILSTDADGTLVVTNSDHGFKNNQIVMIDSDSGTSPDINGSYTITIPTELTGTSFTTISTLIEGMYIYINGQRLDITCNEIDEIIALINDANIPHIRAYNSSNSIVLEELEGNDIVLEIGSPASILGLVGATYTNGDDIVINGVSVPLITGTAKAIGASNATYTNGETIIINGTTVTLSSGTDVDDAVTDINNTVISPAVTASKKDNGILIISSSQFTLAEGSGTALADLGLTADTYTLTSTIDNAVTDINAALIPNIVAIKDGGALRITDTTTSLIISDGTLDTALADLGLVAGTYNNVLTEIKFNAGIYSNKSTTGFVIQNTINSDSNSGTHPGTLGVFTESRFANINDRDTAKINATLGFITFVEGDYAYVDTRNSIDDVPRWEVYIYNGISWDIATFDEVQRTQTPRVDVNLFQQSLLYNNLSNITDIRINMFDPAKGLFPSQATKEISYRIEYDPAKYTHGDETTFQIDPLESWNESHLGKVWWDLSSIEYLDYEHGSNRYRRNNWGEILPGKSIDVYDWVKSSVPPLEWASYVESNADQPEESFDYKPSGEAYMTDVSENPPYTQKTYINPKTKLETIYYYFWVKNSETVPGVKDRNRSVAQIARAMTNPTFEGIPWFAPISNDAIIISGVEQFLSTDNSVMQLNYNYANTDINVHREWVLSRDGDEKDVPTDRYWNKMRDSLVGFDVNNDLVPDPSLEESRKYGNFIRPRQTWFIDKEAATLIFIDTFNGYVKQQCIVDERPNLFDNLNNTSSLPTGYVGPDPITQNEYNFHVADNIERDALATNSIITLNEQVWVDGITETLGFWKIYTFDGFDIITQNPIYTEIYSEAYKVSDFWEIIDYYDIGYDTTTNVDVIVDTQAELNAISNAQTGMIVRVNDSNSDSNNIWALYIYNPLDTFNPWVLIAKQDCTIQFNSSLFVDKTYGNVDNLTMLSGRDQALREVIDAFRNDILSNLEQNQIFYTMLRYVFSEQSLVDWAFKTSYILAIGLNQAANQKPILINDTTQNIIDFINEAKPYHTKLRDFITNQTLGTDVYLTHVTDFDKPVYYDIDIDSTRVLDPNIQADVDIMSNENSQQYDWFTNYTTAPKNIRTSNMTLLFDRVSCEASGGWDNLFGWDFGANENWDLASFDLNETAADRIIRLYVPQPLSIQDVESGNVDPLKNITETKDIASLISGCNFKGTIVDGKGLVIDIDDIDTYLSGGPLLNPGAPINPDDIIVDGNLFIQPGVDSGHPEELVLSAIGESISVITNTSAMFEVVGSDISGTTFNNGETIIINGVTITLSSGVFPEDAVTDINNAVANAPLGSLLLDISASYDGTSMKIVSTIDNITLTEGSGTALVDLGFINPTIPPSISGAPNTSFRLFLNNVNAREAEEIKPFAKTTLDAPLSSSDTEIFVTNTTGMPGASTLIVGSYVGGIPYYEFIEYTTIVNNTISGLTRDNPLNHNSGIVIILDVDKSEIAQWESYRINDSATTTLAVDFKLGDVEMEITSVVGLPKQKASETLMKIPGVIWIENERIEYYRRDGTTLSYIRRGTGGTSSGIANVYAINGDLVSSYLDSVIGDIVYPAGTRIIDGTQKQAIPGDYEWESTPAGLQSSNSPQATFLKNGPGSY